MIEFFTNNFNSCIWLAVIIIAMIPSLEGRIAIPFALSLLSQISPFFAFILAFIGSIVPSIPIIYFIKLIKRKNIFFNKKIRSIIDEKYKKNILNVNNKTNNIKKLIALSLFVAIPLPMTGVWSGSIIAGFTNLNLWQCFLSICIGSFIACGIILGICLLFGNNVIWFLIISLCIISLITIFETTKFAIKKRKSK